jgi:Zn-dependent peptidase ImmA (M78 family)
MPTLEEKANKLLSDSSVSRAPVPVERIAEQLNIEVRYAPGMRDVSGALIQDGDSVVIAVNSAQHENRQRFTIAHEIGHYVLDRKDTKLHFDEDFSVSYRNSLSSAATDKSEIDANQFAAALLMPASFIRKDLMRLTPNGTSADAAVQSLATKYKVSTRAMEFRLLNLGFLSPVSE